MRPRRYWNHSLMHSDITEIRRGSRGGGGGAGARAHPWEGGTPFKIHNSIAFIHQSITGRHPLGEILYPSQVRKKSSGSVQFGVISCLLEGGPDQ